MENETIGYQDFQKLDIRVGRIVSAEPFPEAHNPSYRLQVDFGALGIKKSSAQITERYSTQELVGKQVVAIVNFPAKQIANTVSEVLVLGVPDKDEKVVLLSPDWDVPLGGKMY